MEEHYFGGAWTEIKLEILKDYLNFYTKALHEKKFDLLYIDAFAGTGQRTEILPSMPILQQKEQKISLDGSARIALNLDIKFDRYLFIENNPKRIKELKQLRSEFADAYIKIQNGDANKIIKEVAQKRIWDSNKFRGVIFLDPYGLEVSWDTLEAIAETKSLDVWYLFPISGVCRQASLDFNKMEEYKKKSLDKLFGTRDWQNAFYEKKELPGLFDTKESVERKFSIKQIEDWVSEKLKSIFTSVSKPLPLPAAGSQLYSLYFCTTNPSPKAIRLAQRVANHILKQR